LAAARSGVAGAGRPAAQARRLEDAVDVVPVEMRQEVADHEGEVIQREAGGPTQFADHGALLLARLPGQPVRAAGTILAGGRAALAPLAADRLGADPVALGQDTGALARAGDLGAHGRGRAGIGMDGEHQAAPLAQGARPRPSKRQAYASTAQRA